VKLYSELHEVVEDVIGHFEAGLFYMERAFPNWGEPPPHSKKRLPHSGKVPPHSFERDFE
jgi:hypothetical protein